MQIADDLMMGKRRFQYSGDRLILPDWMMALDVSIREGKFRYIIETTSPMNT